MDNSHALPTNEAECVRRVLGGDRSGFRTLVEAYEPSVWNLCRRLLDGDATEAEDVSQETFLRAYTRLGELKDPYRFGPWLYRIARSLCRDRVRHLAAERRALDGRRVLEWARAPRHGFRLAGGTTATSATSTASGSEGDGDVGSALAGLPSAERRVLELKYFEGRSYEEIAAIVGLSFPKVDHLIRKARSRLRARLHVARRTRERSL